MMKISKKLFKNLVCSIYPNKCKCCGELIEEGKHFCQYCDELIERNNLQDICLSCGFEKASCVCKYNVYRFNALICVFKNIGVSQKTYYKYKFAKRQHYAEFFTDEMCSAIEQCYKDITFDIVCAVPAYKKHRYNHSGYLAQGISKHFNVPYAANLLLCKKRTKKQHRSTIDERLSNVEEKYCFKERINDKTVLLVDDIKTTGATLDECSKMLLYAGAKEVYCVTVLGAPD